MFATKKHKKSNYMRLQFFLLFSGWSLTLREDHMLKVFANSVLRKIFWTHQEGSKRRLQRPA
jgi:hypothetical protein